MPNVIVISGANVAGKSTIAPRLLRDTFGIVEYVNADVIAEGLSAFASESVAFEAGRIMLKRLDELAARKSDFAFETTLASRSYANKLKNWQDKNYKFHLIFLWLQNSDLAVERVRERVRFGGHDIPEATIHRRYKNGLRNFFELYSIFADSWRFYDVSTSKSILIALKDETQSEIILERIRWTKIKAMI